MQSAWLVQQEDHQRDFVGFREHARLSGEKDETRVILAMIFEMGLQDAAAINLRRATARNRCPLGIARPHNFTNASAGVFGGYPRDCGMCLEKARALRQSHGVRLYKPHLIDGCAGRADQVMGNRQDHFRDDIEFAFEQQVVTPIYRTGQAIFDWRENEVGRAIRDRRKHGLERRAGNSFDLPAKELDGSLFAESAWLALESHATFW